MQGAVVTKAEATQIGLFLWAGLLFLLALPVAFLALISLEKLLRPTDLNHMALELLLVLASIAGLLSPLAFASSRRSLQFRVLAVGTVVVASAIAALFSPLYRGFIH